MEEEWRDIPGYEGKYQTSNTGKIRTLHRRVNQRDYELGICELKQSLTGLGYKKVALNVKGKRTTQLVHRLVAMAFIPNPECLPQVNHKDENKTNNDVSNLEWCTALYNVRYGTGQVRGAEIRKNNMTAEYRQSISDALRKRWANEEWRRRQVEKLTEHHRRPDIRARIAEKNRGRRHSAESNEKNRQSHLGVKLAPQHAENVRKHLQKVADARRKEIYCVELDAVFDHCTTAAAFAHLHPAIVQKCCAHSYQHADGSVNKAGGYTWEYYDKDTKHNG